MGTCRVWKSLSDFLKLKCPMVSWLMDYSGSFEQRGFELCGTLTIEKFWTFATIENIFFL